MRFMVLLLLLSLCLSAYAVDFAIRFGTMYSYVELPRSVLTNTDRFCVEGYANFDNAGANQFLYHQTQNEFNFGLLSGRMTFSVKLTDGMWHNVTSSTAAPRGSNFHFAVVYSRVRHLITIFVNGIASGSTTMPDYPLASTDNRAWIGSNATFAHSFNGNVRCMRFSNVDRYTSNFTPPYRLANDSNTVSLWQFDEGYGSQTMGTGSAPMTGTLVNANWYVTDSVTMVRPIGGEQFRLGSSEAIRWILPDHFAYVRIELNPDYPNGNWTRIYDSIPNTRMVMWEVDAAAASHARIRFFAIDDTTMGDTSEADFTITGLHASESNRPMPSSLQLSQPSPNPFNATTTIEYGLPKADRVELALYDCNGRLVRTLPTGNINPGWHRTTIDLRDLNSGVYLCRLSTGSTQIVRKLVLIK